MGKSGGHDEGGTLRDLERVAGVRDNEARALEPVAGGGEKPPTKLASVGPANAGVLPAALLTGWGTTANDDP